MFTGLVQEVGKVVATSRFKGNLRLAIESKTLSSEISPGNSICVNGVCLSIVNPGRRFEVEVGQETLSRTNLSELKAGNRVNLESPMKPSSAFAGHFVTGHVDGTARIRSIRRRAGSQVWEIETPRVLDRYMVEKGNVCVDGVSLTVASVKPDYFTVSLIPHTLASTTLEGKRPGDVVNIEADILAKHIEKLISGHTETTGR
ncbi:MAG: riboflavin synthase [bacterium]